MSDTSARDRAFSLLAPVMESKSRISGFYIERSEEIGELDVHAYVMRHQTSGARLLYLACEDENKAFAIAFKTPPADSTGVFHILEHSVLCGSAKFPVKEPFVELIKSSMQTFLNAMTYPDKTVYPVASTNEQDLLNLMDVYMDAVLNPAIYTKPTIFEQEGWHLELDEEQESGAYTTHVNGVVYNEMRGALSDPMSVLDDAVNAALFPDTAYAHESGGDPKHIPELSYEQFLETHARHYTLENSYITLYGDMDPERVLNFLDERYLGDKARERDAATRKATAPHSIDIEAALYAGSHSLGWQEPVSCEYKFVEMNTAPENALIGLAYVLGGKGALDRKRTLAADVLFSALLGSNEAPVKKALMAAHLGGNVLSYTEASVQQPFELIIVQGAKSGVAHEVRRVAEEECRRLVQEGIPRERLAAVLAASEFELRQRDSGVADGVALACSALSTWLYDDSAATRSLVYAPLYEELREELEGSYFEDLLRELVLENTHTALIDLQPTTASTAEQEKIAEACATPCGPDPEGVQCRVSKERAAEIDLRVQELRRLQEAEDTPAAKATLPRLHISDITESRQEPACVFDTTTPLPCLGHYIPTHRLTYATEYFDLSCVSFDELPYVSLMCTLMTQLATKRRRAEELDIYISSHLGFLSFSPVLFQRAEFGSFVLKLQVNAGALSEKVDKLAEIAREVWAETCFDDLSRVRDVITQSKIALEQGFLNAGHTAALARALSYVSPAALVSQHLAGVDYYHFLVDTLEHFDTVAQGLCAKLAELQARIFVADAAVVSFTGAESDCTRFWQSAGDFSLVPRGNAVSQLVVPEPRDLHEAFIIPSDVCFAARATDPRILGLRGGGVWNVASRVLSFDYLWNEIRVKGGAYGCGFRVRADRELAFYTYRDPGIDASQERIARAGQWLTQFETDPASFEGFIVSCVASFDAPIKPYALGKRQDAEFFSERIPGWREQLRSEVLHTSPEALRALGADVTNVAGAAPFCVFGSREIISSSTTNLQIIELF